ncbi:MAG TPA: hypothetical protein VM165_24870 [Planctomycetaceae bacterium]|nr:hypothetical protein [Planctomycetaceae bacterium]
MTDAELQQLAREGGLASDDAISSDGVVWQLATTRWAQLQTRSPVPLIPAGPLSTKSPTNQAVIGVVVIAGMGILGLGLCCAGWLVPGESIRSQPAMTAIHPGQATWTYWHAAAQILASGLSGSANRAAMWEAAASDLADLPTVGVDPDAVALVLNYAALFRQAAALAQRERDPTALVEAAVRTLGGDPFGTAVEHVQARRLFEQNFQQVSQQSDAVRAVLSQRYGRELPPLNN